MPQDRAAPAPDAPTPARTSLISEEARACGSYGLPPADTSNATPFELALNELLVGTFHSIERYEENVMRSAGGGEGVSTAEAHVIDAVGRLAAAGGCGGATVTQIADELGVSLPSVTSSVNRLVRKGLLAKSKSVTDARSVIVSLTESGLKAYRLHAMFHQRMTRALSQDLTPEERTVLTSGIQKLEAFFSAPIERARTPGEESGAQAQHQEV